MWIASTLTHQKIKECWVLHLRVLGRSEPYVCLCWNVVFCPFPHAFPWSILMLIKPNIRWSTRSRVKILKRCCGFRRFGEDKHMLVKIQVSGCFGSPCSLHIIYYSISSNHPFSLVKANVLFVFGSEDDLEAERRKRDVRWDPSLPGEPQRANIWRSIEWQAVCEPSQLGDAWLSCQNGHPTHGSHSHLQGRGVHRHQWGGRDQCHRLSPERDPHQVGHWAQVAFQPEGDCGLLCLPILV